MSFDFSFFYSNPSAKSSGLRAISGLDQQSKLFIDGGFSHSFCHIFVWELCLHAADFLQRGKNLQRFTHTCDTLVTRAICLYEGWTWIILIRGRFI